MTATTLSAPGSLSSCDLFLRCLEGRDDGDWRRFLARCRRMLPGLAAARLDPWTRRMSTLEVEDLLQEVHCRLLSAAGLFRGRTDRELWAYLRRVVASLTTDHRRRWQTIKRSSSRVPWPSTEDCTGWVLPEPGPEERLLRSEDWECFLERCGRCFPRARRPLVRRVVRLVWVEGCNSREASEHLDGALSPKDIDNLVARLRRRLARQGLDLPRRSGGRRSSETSAQDPSSSRSPAC